MLVFLTKFLAILPSILRSRAAVELENLALRHQIGVLQRSAARRPKLTSGDRLFWICLSRLWPDWRSAVAIVKPETVVAWHRAAFRLFWTWKVRHGQRGRPVVLREVRDLIRKMCRENPLWGVHPASMANCSNLASTSLRAASANTWFAETKCPLRTGGHSLRIMRSNWSPLISSRCRRSASRFFTCFWCWPMTVVAFCTSMSPPTQLQSGRDNKCARPFPSSSFRATCCATVMPFSVMISENSCEIWASARSYGEKTHPGQRAEQQLISEAPVDDK